MGRGKKEKIDDRGDLSLDGGNAFSLSIGELLGKSRKAEPSEPPAAKKDAATGPAVPPMASGDFLRGVQQATLHREASGRGGRTVTLVSLRPEPNPQTAEALAKAMRKGLGCGSHVEGAKVVLQGDIQDRAGQWLEKQGVKRVVMGN